MQKNTDRAGGPHAHAHTQAGRQANQAHVYEINIKIK